jgi:hypothetical protein
MGTSNNDDLVVGSTVAAARRSFSSLIWCGCVCAFCCSRAVRGAQANRGIMRHPLQRHKPADVVGRHKGHHHFIDLSLVADVEGQKVRVSANAAVAVTMEKEQSSKPV